MAGHVITGGAGFIGSNLAGRLLDAGHPVLAIDNLSRGRTEFLARFRDQPEFQFHAADSADSSALLGAMKPFQESGGIAAIWHLAANSDIPSGIADPRIDLKDTFLTTFAVLEAIRTLSIPVLHFASSSAVYGDLKDIAIREDSGPLAPISNYGAMKLASEAIIRTACEHFLPTANILRFPNVVGVPATHGVILDLIRKARAPADGFAVLGDGSQRKIYLHVDDLVGAMQFIAEHGPQGWNVFNIGPNDDGITVRDIAAAIRSQVAPKAAIRFGTGNRGWPGDIPQFRYDVSRLAKLGWTAAMTSAQAIGRAVAEVARQEQSH